MVAAARILVVEDEDHLAEGICANLEAEGYLPVVQTTGPAALAYLADNAVDLVVLDVMLPGRDGFDVCRTLRRTDAHTPVLFLTARASAEERVLGLRLGGDDYLGKPFHLAEFLGRVAALLRRRQLQNPATPAATAADPANDVLTLAGSRIDFRSFQLTSPDGRSEEVPARELAILRLLWRRQGEVVSRDDILDQVWGHDVYPSSRTVDNFIVRLRRRLEPDPALPRYLHTIRGVGYRLSVTEQAADALTPLEPTHEDDLA